MSDSRKIRKNNIKSFWRDKQKKLEKSEKTLIHHLSKVLLIKKTA
jgi:hypothetical protein